jgi:hypothetical protein
LGETEASVRVNAGAIEVDEEDEEEGCGRWVAMDLARDANLEANMVVLVCFGLV